MWLGHGGEKAGLGSHLSRKWVGFSNFYQPTLSQYTHRVGEARAGGMATGLKGGSKLPGQLSALES